MISKLLIIAGSGTYPLELIKGAKHAGIRRVDVMAVRGSCDRATKRAADSVVFSFGAGEPDVAIRWAKDKGYDGAIFAGQVNPLALFRSKFTPTVKEWLRAMPVKNAHTIFGKLVLEFERAGIRMLPASSFMDDCMPGIGALTARRLTEDEEADVERGREVAADIGRHDVGQTVLVKSGMVMAVEAFEGTNATIRRAGKLGKGSILFKAAREGHDWRFDIPVVGMKTLKTMKRSGVTALAFQAGRLVLLDREQVVKYANSHDIAIVGIDSNLPIAPLRP